MDPKKQELNPELKEIYERVMNTQVKTPASSPPVTPPPAQNPSAPTAVSPPAGGSELGSFAPAGAGAQSAPNVETKPFVFTGSKITTPQDPLTSQSQTAAPGKKISGPIIIGSVVILVILWGLFWAKIFGLI